MHPERIEAEQPPLWPRERPRPEDRPILACADNLDFMGWAAAMKNAFFTFVSRVRSDDRRYRREFDALYDLKNAAVGNSVFVLVAPPPPLKLRRVFADIVQQTDRAAEVGKTYGIEKRGCSLHCILKVSR